VAHGGNSFEDGRVTGHKERLSDSIPRVSRDSASGGERGGNSTHLQSYAGAALLLKPAKRTSTLELLVKRRESETERWKVCEDVDYGTGNANVIAAAVLSFFSDTTLVSRSSNLNKDTRPFDAMEYQNE
jgi:hypothetical protein